MATAKLHQSVSRLLQHTIASFCRERVTFARKLRVVGLVALTIDDEDADVLMKMDETFVKDGNGACEEDDDEDEDDAELHAVLESGGDVARNHVDSSTVEDVVHPDDIFAEEAGEEADTNFCLLEDEEEVMPLPPPLSSVIDRLRDVDTSDNLSAQSPPCTAGSNDSNGSTERIQICTSTSIVTPLFYHKQKRKRFKPMRHGRPFNGLVSNAAGSHSSEEPPSPGPYPSSNGAVVFPLLGDVDPKSDDLPLPPLPSSDTASGGEEMMELSEGHENQAILLNGIDCSTTCSEDAGDMIPMSPVPGDVVEDVDDEELQITGEDCRPMPQPLLPASLPPPPPPPPPQLTALTLPLLSLPLRGATALNSIPLIPLRQVAPAQPPTLVSSQPTGGGGGGGSVSAAAAPRQFALLAPGTGILLPSASGASATAPAAAAFLATATATKSLTLTAVPAATSATPTTNSASMSLTTISTVASSAVTLAAKTKSLTCSTNSVSATRSRRSTLKIHHSPLPIPAAAAALRPLPTMTSSASVASSLMRHYNCRYCGKTFNRKFCLERHERLHTGVKPYACSCCGERFIRLEDKKRHVRTVHEPQPPGSVTENSASASGDDGGSDKSAAESCGGGGGGSGGGSSSTSAHMLSIISAVAAAAAAASNGGTDRKVGAVNER